MFALIGFGVLFVWFVASIFIANFTLTIFGRWNWVRKITPYFITKAFFTIVVFIGPFLPNIILHYYQVATMPYVCERMAGYKPYNPVKINSIRTYYTGIQYLALPNVNYVEWEKLPTQTSDFAKGFELGKYRFQYYKNGASECKYLVSIYPDIDARATAVENNYKTQGYPLKDTVGLCIGAQKISEFTYDYFISDHRLSVQMNSGYGYKVNSVSKEMIRRIDGEVMSRFQRIEAESPTPFMSIFSDLSFLKKDCLPYVSLDQLQRKKLVKGDLYSDFVIERGFFAF